MGGATHPARVSHRVLSVEVGKVLFALAMPQAAVDFNDPFVFQLWGPSSEVGAVFNPP
jgi:hypothetical protein